MQLYNVNSSFIIIKFAPNFILNLVLEPCFDVVIAGFTVEAARLYCIL
jgi:hypothetical protein